MAYRHSNVVGFVIYDVSRDLTNYLQHILGPYDLTPAQWNVLNQIERDKGINQKHLSEKANKMQPTMTKILNSLEKKGFIDRVSDAADKRAFLIVLTEQGERLREEVRPVESQAVLDISEGISPDELTQFLATMDRIKKNCQGNTLSELNA